MKEVMEEKERMIDEVLDNFNFERVLLVMKALSWTWVDGKGSRYEPNLSDLRWAAEGMLDDVLEYYGKDESCSMSSGGFKATCNNKVLTLEFVVEEEEAE